MNLAVIKSYSNISTFNLSKKKAVEFGYTLNSRIYARIRISREHAHSQPILCYILIHISTYLTIDLVILSKKNVYIYIYIYIYIYMYTYIYKYIRMS